MFAPALVQPKNINRCADNLKTLSDMLVKEVSGLLSSFLAFTALCASPMPPRASSLPVSLNGVPVNPLELNRGKVDVFVFVRTDCPICNRYAPVIQGLDAKYQGRNVKFWLVFPDPSISVTAVRQYLRTYGYHCGVLLDPHHFLVKRTGVQITPEAAVISATGTEIYHGRIDNRYVDYSTLRRSPTVHDLDSAIQGALAGKEGRERSTSAVGCFISDLQ